MATQTLTQVALASNALERRRTTTSSKTSSKSTGVVSRGNNRSVTMFDKPSPLDFDAFVPWVCLEWRSPQLIVVTRYYQEPYIRKTSLIKSKYNKNMKFKHEHRVSKHEAKFKTDRDAPELSSVTVLTNNNEPNYSIPVSALYDSQGNLREISIVNSPFELNCKLIVAISLCIPFHAHLTKLSITKGGLTSLILHEISKILPHSNISEICLDDSHVPEGNYFELLDHTSQLKVLSLNRCQLNDIVCKEIAARIDHGGMTLSVLSLASNFVTDAGAWFIGSMLRKNRHLLYLNLSDNRLTSKGLKFILRSLIKFPLTSEEIMEKKRRSIKFIQKRIEVSNDCLERIKQIQMIDEKQNFHSIEQPVNSRCGSARKKKCMPKENYLISVSQIGDMMAKEITGEFIDPFDIKHVDIKDGYHYCIGNMVLCSLNLAYNNLDYCAIQMILDVLLYQSSINKPTNATGLMKLQLDGNYMPQHCSELDEINKLLSDDITQNFCESHGPMTAGKKKSVLHRRNQLVD